MLVLVEVLALIVASEYSLSISIVLFSLDEFGFSWPKKLRQKLDTKTCKERGQKEYPVKPTTFTESRKLSH